MASIIYVFHIASLYDRRGGGTVGTDMIDYNSKTTLFDATHRINVCCSILTMYDHILIGGKPGQQENDKR